MSRTKHTEAQMIGALKQMEAGRKAEDVAREVGVSKHTIYAWKAKYGGMDVSARGEATAGGEQPAAQAGGGSQPGQRGVAVGVSKKRVELVARKAAIERMSFEYAFSVRRACGSDAAGGVDVSLPLAA